MPRLPAILVLGLGFAGFLVACGDDPAAPVPDPPASPPSAAFALDVSFFEDNYVPPALAGGLRAAHGGHFGSAALRAMEIGLPLEGRLAAHAAAFAGVAEETPAYRDGAHVWETSLPAPVSDAVRLEAYDAGFEIRWIARRDTGEGFRVWFHASVDTAGLSGTWTFHDPFDPTEPIVTEVAWAGTPGETGDLDLLFTWPAGHELHLDKAGYLHDLTWTPAADDEPWRVNWNAESQEGSLIAPDYWSGARVCWDWHLDDTSCLGQPGS
jgi:hypothetical protein